MPSPKHAPYSAAKARLFQCVFLCFETLESFHSNIQYVNHFTRVHNLLPLAREEQWQPVSISEIKYVVVVLLEIIIRRPRMLSCWFRNLSYIPSFGYVFQKHFPSSTENLPA
jgi:hypothetical protein